MSKYWLGGVCIALTLAGCAFSGDDEQQVYPQRYTLQAATAENAAASSQHFPVVLRVADLSAPSWLDSSRMYYQLAYEQQGRIAAYSQSRWVQSPPEMLGQQLQDVLAGSDAFAAVTGGGAASADMTLQVSLSDFVQRFTSQQQSFGVLSARATLVAPDDGRVLAQQEFDYRVAAPSADASGGVQALGTASGRFASAISQWVQTTLAQCAPQCLERTR